MKEKKLDLIIGCIMDNKRFRINTLAYKKYLKLGIYLSLSHST